MKRIFEAGETIEVNGSFAVIVTVCRISLIVRFVGEDFTRTIRKSKVTGK
jgi:hypothetical protein